MAIYWAKILEGNKELEVFRSEKELLESEPDPGQIRARKINLDIFDSLSVSSNFKNDSVGSIIIPFAEYYRDQNL